LAIHTAKGLGMVEKANGTRIFRSEIPLENFGLSFKKFFLFWNLRKPIQPFHLHSNRNFLFLG